MIDAVRTKPFDTLAYRLAAQLDMNGPACQGRRQLANERHRLRRPGAKSLGFVVFAGGPNDIGIGALVAAVKNASQFVTVFQERIGLIDQQCRPPLFDGPKECRRRDIGGWARTRDERASPARHAVPTSMTYCLRDCGLELQILAMNLDTSTPTGKLMLNLMGSIAEFEGRSCWNGNARALLGRRLRASIVGG